MTALAIEFEQIVRSADLRTQRQDTDDGFSISVSTPNGVAEMIFHSDQIIGVIDSDFIHTWGVLPNFADIRASARKIVDMIG